MELAMPQPIFIVPRPYYRHVFPYRQQPMLPYQQHYHPRYPVDHTMIRQAAFYNNQNVPRDQITSRWTSPGPKRYKLNTDGSSKGNPGPSSYGGLIREDGEWKYGFIGRKTGRMLTSLEAEVWGIYYGLCLIRDKKLSHVMIETDCEAALVLLREGVDKEHPLRGVLEEIQTIRSQQECGLFHTRRDGNHCADQLAKLGGSQFKDYVELEKPPALLLPYLEMDRKAAKEFEKMNQPRATRMF